MRAQPRMVFSPLMRLGFLSLVSGALALLPRTASAQSVDGGPQPAPDAMPTTPATRAMSLPEAIAYAHDHQPAVHAALARIAARTAEAQVPSGQWMPSVGVSAQLYGMTANNTTAMYLSTDALEVPRIGGTPAASTSSANLAPYASTFVGAGLTQELFDFGRIGAQRAATDALVDVARRSADAVRLDVDLGVEEAYFAVLAAKAIVRASDEAYGRSRVHRDLAKRGVDAGVRSPIDLTRAEADLARFDVDRVRARGGLTIAQAVLGASMGAPEMTVDTSSDAMTPADMPTIGEALQLAQTRDPVLAAAEAQLRAAERATTAVGAELRPNLALTAGLSGRAGGAPPSGNAPTPSGNGWLPDVPNWDVGVVLSWPIFDGVVSARSDAARSTEQVRRDEIDVVKEQEVARVHKTFAQVQVSRQALVALQNTVVAARANYDQADARFKSGLGNAVELADAEAVRTDAEIELAIGQFELARSRAAFGRAIAEGLR